MNGQGTLNFERYPNSPGSKGKATSREAAKAEAGNAAAIRAKVGAWFRAGHTGSGEECAAALGLKMHSVRSRCSELEKGGIIEDSGTRTISKTTGKAATVWRLKT